MLTFRNNIQMVSFMLGRIISWKKNFISVHRDPKINTRCHRSEQS